MATDIFTSLVDHSPLDGTNDAINGAEVDANPNVLGKIMDGTTATDLATDSTVDFRFTSSRAGMRAISTDNAAGSIYYGIDIEWDPADGAQMTDGSSGIGMRFLMPDDGDTQTVFARLTAMCVADTGGSEEGEFSFNLVKAGTITEIGTLAPTTGLTLGVDDTGYDIKAFMASAGAYFLVDESADRAEIRGAAAAGAGSLLLSTAELTNVDGGILGRIDFQAPLDNADTDARLVGASIWAEADATFTSTVNTTDLVFAAATSETAGAVMRMKKASLSPETTDGMSLGTTALNWSDLFLDSGAVVNFDSGDVTLTHTANTVTVAGGTWATAALTASTITGSGILKTDDATDATSTTDGSLQTDGGLSVAKDAIIGNDLKLLSDSAVLALGDGSDATLTHDGTTGVTIAANPITITSATAATWSTSAGALTVNGAGGVNVQEGGATIIGISDSRVLSTSNTASIDMDATGAIAVNSSGGVISVANDNVDQNVNLATAGTRTLNIGILDGTDTTTITSKGNQTHSGTITVGANTDGYDVKFFGDTASSNLLWDESADDLIFNNAGIAVGSDATGDVYYRDSSGFLERVGIGSDGQVLTSTGSVPNWEAASSGTALTGSTNNTVATVTGANAIAGEANLTFDGTTLTLTGDAVLAGTSELFINDTANGNSTVGLTVLQPTSVSDQMVTLKGVDVATGMTGVSESDSFMFVAPISGTGGGAQITSMAEDATTPSFQLRAFGGDANTTKTAGGAHGYFMIQVAQRDGSTNVASPSSNENVFGIEDGATGNAWFFVDFEGDIYYDGSSNAFDGEDDISLVRAFDTTMAPKDIIRTKWDDHVTANEDSLVELGILGGRVTGVDPANKGMVCLTQLQRLHNGAIWQLHTGQEEIKAAYDYQREQIESLQAELKLLKG
jgi:hypothetical protein